MAQRLTNLRLNEVSLVDAPANKHARVMLFKRDAAVQWEDGDYPSAIHKRKFTAEERKEAATKGTAMPGGHYPIENVDDLAKAINAIGLAKNTAKAKAFIRHRAKDLGATDSLPQAWGKRDSGADVVKVLAAKDPKYAEVTKGYGDGMAVDFDDAQAAAEGCELAQGLLEEVQESICALSQALWSISSDDTITDKPGAMMECLVQFGDHAKTIVPEGVENALVAQALAQAGYTINPQGGIQLSKEGADSMSKAIAKQLGLSETATETEILAKLEANAKAAAHDASLAKMSAIHKGYMDNGGTMPDGGKDAFIAMEAGARDTHIQKNPLPAPDDAETAITKGEAFRTPEGVLVTKKDAGSLFEVMKGQNTRIIAAEKAAKETKDKADEKDAKDKAAKELAMIGKADEVGGVLFEIRKANPALADKVEVMLKGANDALKASGLTSEIGKNNPGGAEGGTADIINRGAQELLKKQPELKTITKARVEFRKQNPDIAKREQEEAAANRKAA